jgi:5-methylcytosine-specific restriction protein B
MANYYIISIDPLINTFSSIKSGIEFDFSIETEDTNIKEQEIITGDKILVHLDDTVYYNLEVVFKSLDYLKLKKVFEIKKSIDEAIAETGSFQKITKEEFDLICSKLFSEFNKKTSSSIDNIDSVNLKERFSKWLINQSDEGKYNRVYSGERSILIEKLTEYEIAYKNDFNITIFNCPENSLNSIIEALETNVIEDVGEIGELNRKTVGNGSVKAILGPNNYIKFLKELKHIDINKLNTILYGPPGTGKTYSTVDKVVNIISPHEYQEDNHKANKLVYDNLYNNKNVLFTTFHQSMSYEDFVEGIKPKIQDDSDEEKEELTYEISPGIFKIACARAAYNSYKENKITNQTSCAFEYVYQAFIEMALNHISTNDFINCKTITGKDVEIYRINKNDSIKARATGSIATHVAPLTKENIQKLYDTYNSIDEIKNLQQIKDTVGVSPRLTEFYAVFRSLLEFKQTTFQPIKDEEVIEKELNDDEIVRQFDAGLYTKSVKEFGKFSTPIVLVIDEINRGNVSAIFGELITLIEGDKRIGQANEIQLILPYSKVPFSVPPNLFILGTMNTADRSVEALDTALRRRFNFEEMMPDPSLLKTRGDGKGIVAEFKLWKILKTINERIEVLIDRDHTIGHAYLWDVKTITDLKLAFHNKIIPLLQEYFFGNYAKMELVIGAKFFNQKKKNKTIDFAVRNSELDIEPGTRYELLNIQEFSDGEMNTAISNLLVEESKDDE